MTLDTFLDIAVICCLKVNFESISTSKYLTESFCSIAWRFIRIVTGYRGLLLAEKITKFVLDTLSTSRFAFSQFTSLFISRLTVFCSTSSFSDSKNRFVSSANKKNFNLFEMLGKSLI